MICSWSTSLQVLLGVFLWSLNAEGKEPTRAVLEKRFHSEIQPFLSEYCLSCHEGNKAKADLDLSIYSSPSAIARDHQRWEMVLEKIESGEMPPKKATHHPDEAQRRQTGEWIHSLFKLEAREHAGDPGPVLVRRLSNAEYDYSVLDLTGVDLRPTREFPVDPANQDGFDNSGESLTMSPALLKKYLRAAREVADHLVLTQDGLTFAEHPMLADTDRDKYFVLRIVDFYRRQPTDLTRYFEAAWSFQHRVALGLRSSTSLDQIATQHQVSPNYLRRIWEVLTTPAMVQGPIQALQDKWKRLPVPKSKGDVPPHAACAQIAELVTTFRQSLVPTIPNLTSPGVHDGSQCLVLWKDREMAANRRRFSLEAFTRWLNTSTNSERLQWSPPSQLEAKTQWQQQMEVFCSVFPDRFYVSERARVYLDAEGEKANGGRLLSAGFHSMTGYFRDDAPLYDLILDDAGRAQIDRLWSEFEVTASVPERMHTSFIWFERAESKFLLDAEFDFARSEDKDCTSEVKVRQLQEHYCAKAKQLGASPLALSAMQDHFDRVSQNLRRVERLRREAEPKQWDALLAWTAKAYRHPLTSSERDSLKAFYRSLRDQDGLSHDDAIRDCVVSVLMSPHFCYRVDEDRSTVVSNSKPQSVAVASVPLSDVSLASRLSYFLWSGPPDEELLSIASAGRLQNPKTLLSQAHRMIRSEKIRRLATEFGGHWLDFRRFEEHNAVDRARFPSFDDALRQAMFQEPVRFLTFVFQDNRSLYDLLDSDYTFVNSPLAKHYGLAIPELQSNQWIRVEHVGTAGRGGVLGMAVFMTANSPGLRTSPVKRGYWVARRVLGEHIPPPPASVPALPSDESKLGDRTLRETLVAHRADPSCASCHQRFDSLGLVFEGFGPIGERRELDLGGHPVDTHALFPDGSEGAGIEGLRRYIQSRRRDDFVDAFIRKLFGYALGRTLILSDEETVQWMKVNLRRNGYRFETLIDSIVTSSQFRYKRVHNEFTEAQNSESHETKIHP